MTPAYVGEYRYSADAQGRINLPAKLREILAQEETNALMAMKWFDGCVALLPSRTWNEFRPQLAHALFRAERPARYFKRSSYRGMDAVVPDSQGRILLNKDLRNHAGIVSDVVVYGVGEWIECWDAKRFDEYMHACEVAYGSHEELASKYLKATQVHADGDTSGHETR